MCKPWIRKAELLQVEYAILGSFADPMRFSKTVSESVGPLAKCKTVLLRAFIKWACFLLLEEEALKVAWNRMHRNPIFSAAIQSRERKKWKEKSGDSRRRRPFWWTTRRKREV